MMNDATLKEAAIEAKRKYQREYRAKNKERLDEYTKNWRRSHPEKVKEYEEKHWIKQALKAMSVSDQC